MAPFFFVLSNLSFELEIKAKFVVIFFLVTVEIKLETELGLNTNDRHGDELHYKGQKMQNYDQCSHFLSICSALGHGRWCYASIKVFYCLNLHSRCTMRVFDNLSSKGFSHTFNKHLLSTYYWPSRVLRSIN